MQQHVWILQGVAPKSQTQQRTWCMISFYVRFQIGHNPFMVLEIQTLVASGCRGQQNDRKSPGGLFWDLEIVCVLIWVIVTRGSAYVKSHQTLHWRSVRFTVYKCLKINKVLKTIRPFKKRARGRVGRLKMERWVGIRRLLGWGADFQYARTGKKQGSCVGGGGWPCCRGARR